jgi:hypothetical protein
MLRIKGGQRVSIQPLSLEFGVCDRHASPRHMVANAPMAYPATKFQRRLFNVHVEKSSEDGIFRDCGDQQAPLKHLPFLLSCMVLRDTPT